MRTVAERAADRGVPADPFEHSAVFYRGAGEYVAGTVPFITDGLRVGEPVAVVVPEHNLDPLRAALGADGADVHWVNMTVAGRNPGRIIPGVLRAFADRFPDRRVRIVGEPVWPTRSAAEYPACVQHEALINPAFAGRRVTILCPYDAANLAPVALHDAARTHPAISYASPTDDIDPAMPPPGRTRGFAPDQMVAAYNLPLPPAPSDAEVCQVTTGQDLARLRRVVVEFADRSGFGGDLTCDIALAATELASNGLEHGGGSAVVTLFLEPTHLVCRVADRGRLLDALAGRRVPEPGQRRGRGLLMVNQLADLVRVHTGRTGTTIAAWFPRH